MKRLPIVAIDGPAGSGKSTIAKQLAGRLGFRHIDTGALYRAIAWLAVRDGISVDDEDALVRNAAKVKFEFRSIDSANVLHLDQQNVGSLIRADEIGKLASKVSAYSRVREFLLELQRDLGKGGGVVLEGRDIGTVVFPGAEFKFFLTASVDERARRRLGELVSLGQPRDLEAIKQDIIARDHQDMTRAIAPLKKADDAIEMDSTGMTIPEVLSKMESIVRIHA